MKQIFLTTLLLVTILDSVQAQSPGKKIPTTSKQIQLPKVFFIYLKNGPFERECAASMNKPTRQEDGEEMEKRLNEFQDLWEKEGPEYLRTAFEEIGAPFPYREMQATLTVCDFPSMGSPLIIYTKNFLSIAERPQPLFAFPEVVFHEVMHTYLRQFYNLSALRKKYASEAPGTVGQLHLMALEIFVLQKLNKNDVLKWVDIRYRTRLTPAHKRAWEIVNEIEGHEAFIRELVSIQAGK